MMQTRSGLVATLAISAFPWLAGCFSQGQGVTGPDIDAGTGSFEAGFGEASPGDGPSSPPSLAIGAGAVIDFGLADCGGQAPAAKTFTIENTGTTPAHYSLGLSATTTFQLVGATSGDVAPGATATATLATSPVPASATAGQVDQATLTITTDDPRLPMATVTVKRTAQGATLTLSPATVAFGDVPVSAVSQPMPITLSNTGNAVATVTLAAPTAPQFGLTWTGSAGAPVMLAPKAAVPMLAATFAPSASGAASAASAIVVKGAVCGGSASAIPFTGNGVHGVVAVTPGTLDFQKVGCGQTAPPQIVKVTNSGNAVLDFKAVLLAGAASPFTLSPATGSVAPGASVPVTVTPSAIPSVASVAPNAFGDTLRITSNVVGDANHDVSLTETAQGAVLALDHASIPFGDVPLQQLATSPFNVTNTGTLPATVSLQVMGAAFGVVPSTPTTLTVGGSPLAGSATFTPTSLGSQGGSIALSTGATDVVCSAPIGPIVLSGNGVNGVLAVSTTAVDFQSVPCGQAAGQQSFTVGNAGTATFSWTATLGKGASSPYQLSVSSGTQAPGAAPTTVTITPAKIPFPSALTPDLYGDTVTITPSGIVGGAPQTIALTETAKGAVITASPSPLPAFAGQQEGQASAPATLTITNTGTLPASVTASLGGANVASFGLATPGATTLAANGGSYSPGPTFKPLVVGALAAQVNLAVGANDVLCQPLPPAVALSGVGTNGAITLGASSLAIAAQPCGATSGLTQSLKLTNNGTAPLTWSAAILGKSGFTVLPQTGSLAAGGASTTITVTGPTFSGTLGNVTPVSDTLRVTTTAYGDGNHDVPLSSTPSGAILAWGSGLSGFAFGTVQATPGGTKGSSLPLGVTNAGNAAATISFALEGTTPFTFAPQNSALAGGGTLSGSATFDPTSSSGQSDTVVVSVPAGTSLCAPLPAGLPVSGTGAQGTFATTSKGLGFGLTCNAQAASQGIAINNAASALVPYDFTAAIGGTGWSVTPASGTVFPNKPVTLTVTPPAQGKGTPGTVSNVTVTVTTDIPGDAAHPFSVGGTVDGATLAFLGAAGGPQPTLAFGSTVQGTGTGTTYLDNSGNAAAPVDVIVTADPSNADYPSTSQLFINSVAAASWTGTAAVGATTLVYSFSSLAPCGNVYTYTVSIPNKSTSGVCSGTTQVVTVTAGDQC